MPTIVPTIEYHETTIKKIVQKSIFSLLEPAFISKKTIFLL